MMARGSSAGSATSATGVSLPASAVARAPISARRPGPNTISGTRARAKDCMDDPLAEYARSLTAERCKRSSAGRAHHPYAGLLSVPNESAFAGMTVDFCLGLNRAQLTPKLLLDGAGEVGVVARRDDERARARDDTRPIVLREGRIFGFDRQPIDG